MKRRYAIIAVLLSLGVLFGTAYAYFSAESKQEATGKIGTVIVKGSGLDLTNKGNFNPGDEDSDKPYADENAPGATTPHKLSFQLANAGTKSVRTRNIIDISFTDDAELNPDVFKLFEKNDSMMNTELSALKDLNVTKTVIQKDGKKVLRYIIQGASLNGTTGNGEDQDVNAAELNRPSMKLDALAQNVQYTYYFGLSGQAGNEYQGKGFKVEVISQAMQFRNTHGTGSVASDNEIWKTVFADDIFVQPTR